VQSFVITEIKKTSLFPVVTSETHLGHYLENTDSAYEKKYDVSVLFIYTKLSSNSCDYHPLFSLKYNNRPNDLSGGDSLTELK